MTIPHDAVLEAFGIEPQEGLLVPLKTIGEIRASNETVDVYIVELPAKSANSVLSILRSALSDAATVDLQHLRRVIKPSFLPSTALNLLSGSRVEAPPDAGETRFLVISPTALISHGDLEALLAARPPFSGSSFPLQIHILPVPALAPTSAAQADLWSATYWPVAYKHTNPYGPHPSQVSRAQAEIEATTGQWIALAEQAAQQTADQGLGAGVGCVIVERRLDANGRAVEEGKVVVVAGDGRRCGLPVAEAEGQEQDENPDNGNVMNHAVMRGIGLVAQKRLRIAGAAGDSAAPNAKAASATSIASIFADTPLTPLETAVYDLDNMQPNGYLCVDLEIYLSHEPCVMCAMAILHSRFNRCVFARRMSRTGGLTAEQGGGLGHGLFWRPAELNWKFLTWEWVRAERVGEKREHGVDVAEELNV